MAKVSLERIIADRIGFTNLEGRRFHCSPKLFRSVTANDGDAMNVVIAENLNLLDELNPFDDPLLYRRYVLGESYREIAGPQGHASTVKRRLAVIHRRLGEQINKLRESRADDEHDGDDQPAAASAKLPKPKPSDSGRCAAVAELCC